MSAATKEAVTLLMGKKRDPIKWAVETMGLDPLEVWVLFFYYYHNHICTGVIGSGKIGPPHVPNIPKIVPNIP